MKPLRSGMPPSSAMAASIGPDAAPPTGPDARQLYGTLRATGASPAEAVESVLDVYGVQDAHEAYLVEPMTCFGARECLMHVAEQAGPDVANTWLNEAASKGFILPGQDEYGEWGVYLRGLTWLRSLPDGWAVDGDLDLEGCENLERLPSRLSIHGSLNVSGCHALKAIPADLKMPDDLQWDLYCRGCGRLRDLPSGLVVPGVLALNGCPCLESLPAGLVVQGDYLDLEGSGITHLPEGLHVKGILCLNQCAAWDGQIPESAQVGEVETACHIACIPLSAWREQHPHGERA